MRYNEKKGHWPLMKSKIQEAPESDSDGSSLRGGILDRRISGETKEGVSAEIHSVES